MKKTEFEHLRPGWDRENGTFTKTAYFRNTFEYLRKVDEQQEREMKALIIMTKGYSDFAIRPFTHLKDRRLPWFTELRVYLN